MDEKFPLALPKDTILAGQYVIERVLGQGGFGITYEATDHKTGQKVAVKEFFPDTMATRTQATVTAFAGDSEEGFSYGKECFLQEAETLAEFIGNPNIVRVHTYFEENGTAYFVMDFIEGTSFDAYLKERGGRISYEEAERILLPVMDALAAVHSKGIVHRDVTPDNIYITKDGTVKLLDFGAARYSLGDKSRSLDVVLKHGFAPKEQYTRHGRQGPFTDVYALGATFYFAITGRRPPDSIDRLEVDKLIPPSQLGVAIPPLKENALLFALNVQPNKRFQTMAAFRQALSQTSVQQPVQQPQPVQQRYFTQPQAVTPQSQPVQPQPVTPQPQPTTPWTPPPSIRDESSQKTVMIAIVVVLVIAAIVIALTGVPGLIVIAIIGAIIFAFVWKKMKW
jgi:serine/threonine protein kinase